MHVLHQKFVMSARFQESVAAKGHVEIPGSDALAAFMGSYVMVTILILSGGGGLWCCACLQHWKANRRCFIASTYTGFCGVYPSFGLQKAERGVWI